MKRALDLFLGITLLVITLPIMILIAFVILLESPGPIIYKSKRINKFLSKLKSENLIKKIDGEINKFEFKEINATKEIANHLVKLI